MGNKMTITIEVEGGVEGATITCEGQTYQVTGLAIFADGPAGNLFSFFWNSPIVAANAAVRSFAAAYRRGDEFSKTFYQCLLRGLAMATIPPEQTGLDKLEEWEEKDKAKAN